MANQTVTRNMNLEACIQGTYEFAYDNESSGPFSYSTSNPTGGENLTWSTGTGKLWHLEDNGTTGYMIISVSTGSAPGDGDSISGDTSGASCDVDGSVSNPGALADGENITINNGYTLTCTETPSVLIGAVDNYGTLLLDGQNITSGNIINFVGEWQNYITIRGTGTFEVDGDWYDIGTTDGTDSQAIDLSSATGSDYYDGDFCVDCVSIVQIETGRRIDYDNESGITPEIDDYVKKSTDTDVFGRIVEVNTGSSYIIVKYLTGALADDDDIFVEKTIDNDGDDFQISWTAKVNNASGDIKESGIYQEFGNSRANNTSYISQYHQGVGGFVFDNAYQSTTLTLGSSSGSTGGFVPPSGCNIRAPNVRIATSDTTNYASGDTYRTGSTRGSMYGASTSQGGEIDISICDIALSFLLGENSFNYTLSYVGSFVGLSAADFFGDANITSCVFSQDPYGRMYQNVAATYFTSSFSNVYINDCLYIISEDAWGGTRIIADYIELSGNIIASLCGAAWQTYGLSIYSINCYSGADLDNNIVVNHQYGSSRIRYPFYTEGNNINIRNSMIGWSFDNTNYTTSATSFFYIEAADTFISGVHFLGDTSEFRGYLVYPANLNIKFRGVGQIDNKVDFDNLTSIANTYANCYGFDIARIWVDNINGSFYNISTAKNITIRNCSGYYSYSLSYSNYDMNIQGLHTGLSSSYFYYSAGIQILDVFTSDTTGMLTCKFLPPSSSATCIISTTGSPSFNNSGQMSLSDGDQIIFEQLYFMKGHSAFTGSVNLDGGTWTYVTSEFQYDLGSGYNGSWLDLSTAGNLTGITGCVDGIKFKFRFTCSGGAAPNLYGIRIGTTTALSAQNSNLYAIDQEEVDLTIKVVDSDLQPIENVQVAIFDANTGTQLMNEDTLATGIATETYVYSTNTDILIRCRKSETTDDPRYIPYSTTGTILSTGFYLTVQLKESLVLN